MSYYLPISLMNMLNDQMGALKNRPKCITNHFLSKSIHNFYPVKRSPNCVGIQRPYICEFRAAYTVEQSPFGQMLAAPTFPFFVS
jgi:hypothetical protein